MTPDTAPVLPSYEVEYFPPKGRQERYHVLAWSPSMAVAAVYHHLFGREPQEIDLITSSEHADCANFQATSEGEYRSWHYQIR